MSCHRRKPCMVFEHSFLVPARPDVRKRNQRLYTLGSISGRKILPLAVVTPVHAGISKLSFIQPFQITQGIINWWHKAKLNTTDPASVYSTSGKQQAVRTNNDYKYRCILNNSFQKQSNDSSIHCLYTLLNILHEPSEDC